MPTNPPSPTPKSSRFGWPKPARTEEFKKLLAEPGDATERVEFQGKTHYFRVVRVPIELPKYRMANGRTTSLQSEYLAKNQDARKDLFSGDAELWDAQEAQHALLLQTAKQADLWKTFDYKAEKQTHPILLDENGFVVNGNRRLATWRELLFGDSEKYGHFRHVDVAILPHCEEREIDRIEAKLQVAPDIRADYSWDALANMMLAKQKRDSFSNKELAELYKMKEGDIEELLDMRSYADEYLRSRHKENLWSCVSGHEEAFRKIAKCRPKITGVGNQEIFKQSAFSLIDQPAEAGGRLYEVIPAVVESLEQVRQKLQDEFEVQPAAPDTQLDGLFGGVAVAAGEKSIDMQLAAEIQKPENAEKTRKIIVEVIESQKQLKKDAKSANYLLECCSKAQSWLAAAIKDGLRSESKFAGVAKQLDQIQAQSDEIRKYLKDHAQD